MSRRPSASGDFATGRGAAPKSFTPFARGGHGSSPRDGNNTMIDFDAAFDRIHRYDAEALANFVQQGDEAITGCRTGPIDDDMQNIVALVGAARILLRQRRAAAARDHAKTIVSNLISATETPE